MWPIPKLYQLRVNKWDPITTNSLDWAHYQDHLPTSSPVPAISPPFSANPWSGSQMLTRVYCSPHQESVMIPFSRLGSIGQSFNWDLMPLKLYIQAYLILLHFTLLNFTHNCIFYKLEVCGNLVSRKSIGTIFPTASACFYVSGSHFVNSCNISNFLTVISVLLTHWKLRR